MPAARTGRCREAPANAKLGPRRGARALGARPSAAPTPAALARRGTMATNPTPAAHFLTRLDAVELRLDAHARSEPPTGLTDPDPPTGEQWDAGQVWSHLAEILYYW